MRYWLNISSLKSWEVEETAGRYMLGASKKWMGLVSRIQPGDLIAEYLAGETHSFAAVLRATSGMYEDKTPFWPHGTYPYRIDCEPVLLKPKGSIGVLGRIVAKQLTFVRDKTHWGTFLQVKIRELSREDMAVIWNSLARKGAVEKLSLSELEMRTTAATSGSSPLELDRTTGKRGVEGAASNALYLHYRGLGLDHVESRIMELAHSLVALTPPSQGDVIDTHLALDFVLNELSQPTPRGWVREELQRIEERKTELMVKWAEAATLAKLVDLRGLADKLRTSGSYPAGEPGQS